MHIWEERLFFATLEDRKAIYTCFYHIFGYKLQQWKEKYIQREAGDIWTKLEKQELKGLPILGQSQGDFKTFDDALANATGTHTHYRCKLSV